jgi:hypothetical protein
MMIFGTFSGFVVAIALSNFIPQFYTEWAGSLVCPGKVDFVIFKQAYICRTAPNEFFELRDAMFWAIFKRSVLLTLPLCFLLVFGLMKLGEFLWSRREAAGFE